MADFFSEYGLFLAKTLTVVLAIAFILLLGAVSAQKARKGQQKGHLEITHLNDELQQLKGTIKDAVTDHETLKIERKADKAKKKADKKVEKKQAKTGVPDAIQKKRVYVLDFEGDTRASQVDGLRKCITAVLSMAREQDEVILRLESPGGMVHAYGLASAQLQRIREHGITLTICVDKVAASGGYMMACIGNRLVASPFAYVGSIGVLLQLPNFNRLLKEHNVDFEMVTAGEYKRTLTLFGENTEKGREKVTEEVAEVHALFKQFIRDNRPSLDVDAVATGETWYGTQALEKGLVDAIGTSDDLIVEACRDADVYSVTWNVKDTLGKKLESMMEGSIDRAFTNWVQKSSLSRFLS